MVKGKRLKTESDIGKKITKNQKNILRTLFVSDMFLFMKQIFTPHTNRILGIDPGLTSAGWGVVDVDGSHLRFVACGTIKPPKNTDPKDGNMANRLAILMERLQGVITEYRPAQTAVEEVFVNKNPTSTLRLGQARGIALVTPALFDIPVMEYQNRAVKKSVVGTGTATKEQIHMMVKTLLPNANPDSEHAADALAIAITHAHGISTQNIWQATASQ